MFAWGKACRTASTNGGGRSVTAAKRFKRFLLAMLLAIAVPVLSVTIEADPDTDQVLMWVFGFFLLVAAYQFLAMVFLIFARIWR